MDKRLSHQPRAFECLSTIVVLFGRRWIPPLQAPLLAAHKDSFQMPRTSASLGEFSLMSMEISIITQKVQVTSAKCRSPDFISWTLGIDVLKLHISEAALHDSLARYPPPQCYTGTPSRQKVLKIITDWIQVKDSYPGQGILWLYGPARVGKSPIAQTIAERCEDSLLAASFFFLRNDPHRGVANRLFTTLAWQLAQSIPETRPYIESALRMVPLLLTKSFNVQFEHLIVKVFQNLLRDNPGLRPGKVLVIIDGLDNCANEQDQELFLNLIAYALTRTNIPLRFLICSRPEAHIKTIFDTDTMKPITHAVKIGPGSVRLLLYSQSHLTNPSLR